ncbi:DNA polymerase, beta-like region [Delftia sp. Cs1-4]|uniref:DNA polymerase beta-like region n=2 Tax=Delftia TaxID=80865 RepID=UPI00020E80FB|nr:DNA polymerase beta-like region [Delftia sp. Cs1-4]AEF89032.1 DNA polymerase, beta-like region [Delftia sp. Cs1-4]
MKPSEALALNRTGIRHVVESHRATLMDEAAIQEELQRLLGMSVDGLTPSALPEAFRSQVLAEALPM